jgi:D-xylose transport system permease protein
MEPKTTRPQNWLDRYFHSIQTSDFGSMAVVIGLVIISVIFQIANKNFLTPLNLTNLMAQISVIGILSVGIILVLLIGEIDLSVGSVSGAAAAVMAVLITNYRIPSVAAILVAILFGFLIGAMQGLFVGKVHVPSFIVTLAGLMIWQGAQLFILGDQGTINMRDPLIRSIANTLIPPWLGWVIGILAVIIVTYSMFRGRRNRQEAGLIIQFRRWQSAGCW